MGLFKIVFWVLVVFAALIFFRNEHYKTTGLILHEKIDFVLKPVFDFYNNQGWTFLTPKANVEVVGNATNQTNSTPSAS
jgi:hypothetical protein